MTDFELPDEGEFVPHDPEAPPGYVAAPWVKRETAEILDGAAAHLEVTLAALTEVLHHVRVGKLVRPSWRGGKLNRAAALHRSGTVLLRDLQRLAHEVRTAEKRNPVEEWITERRLRQAIPADVQELAKVMLLTDRDRRDRTRKQAAPPPTPRRARGSPAPAADASATETDSAT
jgi:hypothetical protein